MDKETRAAIKDVKESLCRKVDELTKEFRSFRDDEFREFKDNELSHRVTREDCEERHRGLKLGVPKWVVVLVAVFSAITATLLGVISLLLRIPK